MPSTRVWPPTESRIVGAVAVGQLLCSSGEVLGELDRCHPDASGSGLDQDGLPGLELA
jgi:hypothetical protein